jgi:hypothetical protein
MIDDDAIIMIPTLHTTAIQSLHFLVISGRLGHGRCRFIRYRVFCRLLERMNGIDCWSTIDVGGTRLAGALGFGPSCGLVLDVFGRQRTATKLFWKKETTQ